MQNTIHNTPLAADKTVTKQQGIHQLHTILGNEAKNYRLMDFVNNFYAEYGYTDFRTIHYVDPTTFYDTLAPYAKP